MKTVVSLTVKVRVVLSLAVCACCWFSSSLRAQAQTNSWTNSVSGNWEDAYWSLGQLPSTNQSILFTNDGSKSLTLGPNAVENFPETLTVNSIRVLSTPGSVNTLILDHTGLQTGLDTGPLTIGSNSAVRIYSSSLTMHGDSSIAGSFDLTEGRAIFDFSTLNLGESGPSIFSLTNSLLAAGVEYLGGFPTGGFSTVFNQEGGTNSVGVGLVLRNQSRYNFFDGVLDDGSAGPALLVFEGEAGEFNQYGGHLSPILRYWQGVGTYNLIGGTLSCSNLMVPDNSSVFSCDGYFLQSGGTNLSEQIVLGDNAGPGHYSLSGGVLVSTQLVVNFGFNPGQGANPSGFYQSGGLNTNSGVQILAGAAYQLSNGILSTASFSLASGTMAQSGGTNQSADVLLSLISDYSLSGGWLITQNVMVNGLGGSLGQPGLQISTFHESDGTNLVSGNLSLVSNSSYLLDGGRLTAQGLTVNYSVFKHYGGTVRVAGVVNLVNGIWDENSEGAELGQLELGGTNSVLSLSAPNSCILRFSDSSGLAWSNAAVLNIQNWSGSLYGGGRQQIIFGSNNLALTLQQLSQIQFQNPAGLAPGNYSARILATGEIVPDSGAALLPRVNLLNNSSNGVMQLRVEGDIGQSYGIEVSTDLVHWLTWTSQMNTNGTISIDCNPPANLPQRFYRAHLMP